MAKRTKATETSIIQPAPARRRPSGVKTKKATPAAVEAVRDKGFAPKIDRLDPEPSHDAIADRAYVLYLRRGATDGQDMDDWLEAERQLRGSRHD